MMSLSGTAKHLLLAGALPRLAGALVIVGLLWFGFFWATSSPGGL